MAVLDPLRPAAELHRQVRALQPWPGTELTVADTPVKVCAVGGFRPDSNPPGTLAWSRQGAWFTAGDGRALELTLLQRPGKPVQPAAQALQVWGAAGSVLTPRTV
jgi:methionyl-tRNA formyltransferase